MNNVHYLASFAPNFQWQHFAKTTPGVPEDEALINALWQLAKPQAVWRDGRITERRDYVLVIDDGALTIDSAYISQGLAECEKITAMALTLGPDLPEAASKQLNTGEMYRGIIADLLGSYGVEHLAEDFCTYLSQRALPQGLYATLRYSPGYGDWALDGQKDLMAYLAHPKLPITLTESSMLEPVKSITALIGWARTWQKPQYPSGVHGSGFCNGGHNCAACVTWACKRHRPLGKEN